ncbi:hypothetical protein KIH23_10500 [Flavobacterium sp. CYK-55]|uniref:hypothetical protein n=1 Tax=Flavobacterium sp. CYK-55 TaxID=2835529 RepID=UPI001BCF5BA6|nr:hypothetical protein [Flavobacterium sp. CYK-55]MBS7787727.1 hypothetical protein [Flavobacterium sp. CYK-55]
MKKVLFFVLCALFALPLSAQKKKPATAKSTAALAKAENLTVEFIKNELYLFVNGKGKKDTIKLKSYTEPAKPATASITAFTAKGVKLHCISWTENTLIQTSERTEDKTTTYTEIYNLASKGKAFSNAQTTTKIKEIQYLDKLKNASQTVEKNRSEGLAFALNPNGDVSLKNKKEDRTLIYNASSNIYQDSKDLKKK